MPAGEPLAFGRYLLEAKLAAGGMGEVFLARMKGPAGFEKKVVIKRILPHLAEADEFVERFLDEGRLVVQLSHGNLVQVFDMGHEDGHYFLAMEYVDGLDLRVLLKRLVQRHQLLPVPLCLHIAGEVAKGLAYAHGRADDEGRNLGIIHRDVSPSNVMLSREGEVKLLDFGVAKAASRTVHSISGSLHGKFVYMSPEQASGRSLDRRSDIFSLGTCLYEMLAGRRPFEGETELRTLDLIRAGEVAPPSAWRAEIPAEVDAIVERCLRVDPEARYAGAEDFCRAILTYQVESRSVVSGHELSAFVADFLEPRTPAGSMTLDAALSRQLDDLLGASPVPGEGTQAAPAARGAGTPLALDETMPAGTPRPDPGDARRDPTTTGRSLLPETQTHVSRASRGRILIATGVLLIGLLVTFNVVMLYELRSGDSGEATLATVLAMPATTPASSDHMAPAPGGLPARKTDLPAADAGPAEDGGVREAAAGEADTLAEPGSTAGDPAGAGDAAEAPAPRPMRVRVLAARDGGEVHLNGLPAVPDAEGLFVVPGGEGPVVLELAKLGYQKLALDVPREPGADVTVRDEPVPIRRHVKVTVKPSAASIEVGGRSVAQGSHRFVVTIEAPVRGRAILDGYEEKAFKATWNGPKTVDLELAARALGTLRVRIFPVDATVTIDGKPINRRAALLKRKLSPGNHTIEIRSKEGVSKKLDFVITAGKDTTLGQITLASP